MLSTKADMSALEWFFRNPSASNFPQHVSSSELIQLASDLDKLVSALSNNASQFNESRENILDLSKLIGKINDKDDLERSDIEELITKLKKSIELVKNNDTEACNPIRQSLSSILVTLVMVAKSSQDIELRNKVILLAKSFVVLNS